MEIGERLRERASHLLLPTATPRKGDVANVTLFLPLLQAAALLRPPQME